MDFSQLVDFIAPTGGPLAIIRAIAGFFIVLFLPGFAWTLVFFNRLHVLERVALSFGLSIATAVLSIMALNLVLGMKITATSSLLTILMITVVALAIYLLKRFAFQKKTDSNGD